MNIRTLENLLDALDDDFAWRKKELTVIHANISELAKKSNFTRTPALAFNLRAGIALLYAHWEGFIKNGMQMYLDYISNQHLEYQDLKINFAVIGLRGKLNQLKENGKMKQQINLMKFIIEEQKTVAVLQKGVLKTKGNLNSDLLMEIVEGLNLNTKFFELKQNLIDERLLKARNQIAHGEIYKVKDEVANYTELHTIVTGMLTDFKNEITLAAANKSYLKQ